MLLVHDPRNCESEWSLQWRKHLLFLKTLRLSMYKIRKAAEANDPESELCRTLPTSSGLLTRRGEKLSRERKREGSAGSNNDIG
jgi:hypothetical protein